MQNNKITAITAINLKNQKELFQYSSLYRLHTTPASCWLFCQCFIDFVHENNRTYGVPGADVVMLYPALRKAYTGLSMFTSFGGFYLSSRKNFDAVALTFLLLTVLPKITEHALVGLPTTTFSALQAGMIQDFRTDKS